jgi:TatA/E family protein of Tat protein translocase
MFGIGPLELVVILVVALLVFGPKRVPELARTLGRGLTEFRRASNDLRKTLALDELQQDLRRDLSGDQTIHRPEDRPAQAGDAVDSGEKSAANTTGSATDNATDSATDSPADTDNLEETSSKATIPEKHPGELPLGNDHEHNDESDESVETNSNTPADSELGNVPVSGSKPTDPQRG